MAIEQAIFSILTADATLSGLVGARVYPVRASQDGSEPYIEFEFDGLVPEITLDGALNYDYQRVTFNVYAPTYDAAQSVARAIRGVLQNYTGTVSGVTITYCQLNQQTDSDEFDVGLFSVTATYELQYRLT